MLTPNQEETADQGFCIYDHDWRFYSEFLGDPFIVGRCLAYFDGSILYYCAFPLGNCTDKVAAEELVRTINDFPYAQYIRGLNVWGRLQRIDTVLPVHGIEFKLISGCDEADATDETLNLENFSFSSVGPARRARNSALNKKVQTSVLRRTELTWEHIRLIELFFHSHNISPVLASFYLSIPSLIKMDRFWLVEGRVEDRLEGFGILSNPTIERSSMLMSFFNNNSGTRVADGVWATAIEWAKNRNAKILHFGYSATTSLAAFKSKWGALVKGPSYSEAYYATDSDTIGSFQAKKFIWRERVYNHVVKAGITSSAESS